MSDKKIKPSGFWNNYDNCYNAALECKSKTEFSQKYGRAYKVAKKNDWLKDYTWFLPTATLLSNAGTKWTEETLYNAAITCKSRGEFNDKFPGAYDVARKKNLLDTYTWFQKRRHDDWTYETCMEVAKKCSTRNEFRLKYPTAYKASQVNRWIDDYTWFVKKLKPNGFWDNYDNCKSVALKCETLKEFRTKYSYAYAHCCKNDWIKYFTWLKRSENQIFGDVHSVYCYCFNEQNSIYIGRTNNEQRRNTEHKSKLSSCVYKFSKKHKIDFPEMTILEKNLTLEESLIYEDLYVEQYKIDGWNVLNTGKTGLSCGSVGKLRHKWTKNACFKEALKYKTKTDFQKGNASAYISARKNGWLEEYTWFIPTSELRGKKRGKRIAQYTIDGEFIRNWDSMADIQRNLGFLASNICACCRGKSKMSSGFIWKYAA